MDFFYLKICYKKHQIWLEEIRNIYKDNPEDLVFVLFVNCDFSPEFAYYQKLI